jgi:hypothetical protein
VPVAHAVLLATWEAEIWRTTVKVQQENSLNLENTQNKKGLAAWFKW